MNAPTYYVERDRQDHMKQETRDINRTFPQLNEIHMSHRLPGLRYYMGRDGAVKVTSAEAAHGRDRERVDAEQVEAPTLEAGRGGVRGC